MNPMVESAWIAAGAGAVGVIGTATVGIVGYFIARSTNREAITAAKATTDETIASARAENKSTIEAADASVHRTLEATRAGQIIGLYSRAIDQLGSEQLHVRIGGIYALERVARDSEKDHPIVMDVLTAFIREYSREQWPPPDRGERERWTRPDVQAAVTVVGRRDVERDTQRIDLYGAIHISADLRGVTLEHARLLNADLTGAMWSEDKPAPEGWKLRTGSILLDPVGR